MSDQIVPDAAKFWFDAGAEHRARGELEQALACFDKMRELAPRNTDYLGARAYLLAQMGRFEEAAPAFVEAIAIAPESADLHHGLGWVHEQGFGFEEAVLCYQRAAELNPRADGTWNNLANCLQTLGRFDEAREAYRAAIAIVPGHAMYYRNLVQNKKLELDDPACVQLVEQLKHAESRPAQEQAELHFAYAHVLADNRELELSFGHQLRANRLFRQNVQYDEATMLRLFEQLPELFPADFLKTAHELGNPSEVPIFIVGMPRSGSSLVEQILASHPRVFGAGERSDFPTVLAHRMQRAGTPQGLLIDKLRETTAEQWRGMGAEYLALIGQQARGAAYERMTDKYPFNFMHLGFLQMALPNARFIHTRRAPIETCLSIYSRVFKDVPFGYDLAELGRYYRGYHALMAYWRQVLPAENFLEVDYETLVDQPETETRRLLAHCGLEWNERCLSFHETKRQVSTASAAQVRRPMYKTSVKRWHPSDDQLRPLLDALGAQLAGR